MNGSTISSLQSTINSNTNNSNMLSNPFHEFSPEVSKQVGPESACRGNQVPDEIVSAPFQILAIESDGMLSPLEKERRKRLCLYGLSKNDFIKP